MVKKINKKASATDICYVAGILLSIAIVVLIAFKISNELNTKIQADDTINRSDTNNNNRARNSFGQINSMYPGVVDNSFLLLTVGLAIVAFVLAAMVRVHPVFFVFFLFILVIIIFICGAWSNIYQEMADVTELQDIADQLIFITNIMRFLPFIVGTFGFILAIIMYKTWQNG